MKDQLSEMGRYIGVDLEIETPHLSLKPLEGLFSNTYFEPVSLACTTGAVHWFLAGYALEGVLYLSSRSSSPQPKSISTYTTEMTSAYVKSISEILSDPEHPIPRLSPWEQANDSVGLTFIEEVKLEKEALKSAEQWQMKFPRPFVYLYGTVSIAVKQPGNLPWQRVFKYSSPGPELLQINVRTRPKVHNQMDLMILFSTDVWMRGSEYLGDQVGPEEADENLSRLVSVTRSVYEATKSAGLPILSLNVDMKTPTSQTEKGRVSEAFAEFDADVSW